MECAVRILAAVNRADALPLTDMVHRPGGRFPLIEGCGIFTVGVQVVRFVEACIQKILQKAFGAETTAGQPNVVEQLQDLLAVI